MTAQAGHALGQGIERGTFVTGDAALLGIAGGDGQQQEVAFVTGRDELAWWFVVVGEGLGAKLYAAESFMEGFVAHQLLIIADEGADEDVAATGCEDAVIHILAALLGGEIAPDMHGCQGGIEEAELADG